MSGEVLIDHGRMLDRLGIEGQLLMAAAQQGDPSSPVAGASGRTLAGTVGHAGDLCADALAWMGTQRRQIHLQELRRPYGTSIDYGEVVSCFAVGLADLLGEFSTSQGSQPCPTWWPEHSTTGFWLRRMLHATTVHRVDVETAAGVTISPIDEDVATDGIDEILRLWFGYRLNTLGVTASSGWTARVVASDGCWLARATTERAEAQRAHHERCGGQPPVEPDRESDEADAVVAGDASAVYLWLWGRLPVRSIRASGDHDVIAQLWSLLRLATQ